MSTQLQFRRGTTAEHASFAGAQGEITVDTTKKVVVVHDGSTVGGVPMAKAATTLSGYGITDAYTKTEIDALHNTTAFSATLSADQSISSGVGTKVLFNTEDYDKTGEFANARFTATKGGIYHFDASIKISVTSLRGVSCSIYKNGAPFRAETLICTSDAIQANSTCSISADVSLAIGDCIEIYGTITGTTPVLTNSIGTFFTGHFVRS